ncbi:phenylacetate--CoA ligase family protein [Bacteroides acidifaciens]|uniref:phenylacetate--CoA ligase family protein n=1 Tax=Bacteroides acidifaciens TaxID=85831 RepID=UPI002588937E|nr:phenylacetate--CoA ligase family protein [Bacteroides acidifaciens]
MNLYSLYNQSPIFIQNLLCCLQGWRLERQRYNKDFFSILENLIETELWSKEQITSYKEEQIFKIIEYAFKHCSYYHKKYVKHGVSPSSFTCINDLCKFPVLTKEEIRQNWKEILSNAYNTKELIPYHTSGSTGKALDFYWTRHNLQFYWATVWRGRKRFNIHKGDLHLNFTGKLVVPITQTTPPYWRFNFPLNQYMLNMQHITPSKVKDIVNFINKKQFLFYVGYPSIINTFVQLIEEQQLKIQQAPQYIFSSAEKVYTYQQKAIEQVLPQSKIIEHYGFSENAASASKCCQNVYHEDFELGHLELLNPQKNTKGQTGTMLATGFQNYAMPFIRYEIGDTATFSSSECTCGLKSQVITDIEGRNEDYILTPEGGRIMRMDYIFKDTSSIAECQVIQKELGSIILKIVRRTNYKQETEKELRKNIKELISPTLKVSFEYVNEIPRTKSGKFKAVISLLNKK